MASAARKARLRPVLLLWWSAPGALKRCLCSQVYSIAQLAICCRNGGRLQEVSGETPVSLKESGPNPDKVLLRVSSLLTSRR
jgi:hypothetical protein